MIWELDLLLFLTLIVVAVFALMVRDLLAAVALLAAYSLFAALLFAGMAAVDVAFVEAVLGAGVTGVLFIAAIMTTTRRAEDREGARRKWVVLPILAAFVGLMVFASAGLPDRGDPEAPAHQRVAADYLAGSVPDTQTPNVVTAILADYRSQDTLGETLVILTAALAAALVLRRHDHDMPGTDRQPPGRSLR
jgi:multicomponent Na+:H+ antiporter subunit B